MWRVGRGCWVLCGDSEVEGRKEAKEKHKEEK